jgi:hypothetical protein
MKSTKEIIEAGLVAHYTEHHPKLAKAVWQLVQGGQTVAQIYAWAKRVSAGKGKGFTAEGVKALAKHYHKTKSN